MEKEKSKLEEKKESQFQVGDSVFYPAISVPSGKFEIEKIEGKMALLKGTTRTGITYKKEVSLEELLEKNPEGGKRKIKESGEEIEEEEDEESLEEIISKMSPEKKKIFEGTKKDTGEKEKIEIGEEEEELEEEEEEESIEEIKKGMDKSKIEILEKSKKISEFLDEIERDFILFDRNFSLIQNDIEYWSKFTEDRREDIKNEAEERIKNYEELLNNLEKIKNIIFTSREKILDAKKGKLKISLSEIQEIYKNIKEMFKITAKPEGSEDYVNKQLRINEILSNELEKAFSPEYAGMIKKMEETAKMLQKEYDEKIRDSEFLTDKEKSDFLVALQEDKRILEELKAEAGK